MYIIEVRSITDQKDVTRLCCYSNVLESTIKEFSDESHIIVISYVPQRSVAVVK